MDNVLIELAKQIPAMIVLAWLVAVFIKDRREGSKQSAEAFRQRDATIERIASESNRCHEQCAKSIAESSEVIRQNTDEIRRLGSRDRSDRSGLA